MMDPQGHKTGSGFKTVVIILLLLVIAGMTGWQLGHTNKNAPAQPSKTAAKTSDTAANVDVKSLVSYNLPDGWTEGTCPEAANRIYLIPNGSRLDCTANPSAPIKLYVDQQNTTDCQQLEGIQNVRKHVCISLFIDGHKSLKASTEYSQSSAVSAGSTVSGYYINTGKGVVKVEYSFTSSNDYQNSFDQFVTAIKVK